MIHVYERAKDDIDKDDRGDIGIDNIDINDI